MKQLPLFFAFLILFSFTFLIKTDKVWADTVTLTSTADAMIQSANADSKYGSNSHLDVMRSYSPEAKTRSLVQFNLSSVPANASITSATFSIYLYGCGSWSQTINDLNIGRNKDSWQEYQVTWNNKPSFDTSTVLNKTASCSLLNQYHEYDLKSFVTNWLNGTSSNYGVVLYGNEVAGVSWIKFFYGREDAANKPPKLTVTYTLPSTPTGTEGTSNSPTNSTTNTTAANEVGASPKTDGEKSSTNLATSSTNKATLSTTFADKEKRISLARWVLLGILGSSFVAIIVGYLLYKRRRNIQNIEK